jgi:translocator protein
MDKDNLRQWVNMIAIVLTILFNVLANALPFNNTPTGVISDSFPVLFTPAGYVFSIWGVIYIGLIAFGIYQALPSQKTNPRLRAVSYLFALSCLANVLWLFAWHYGFRTNWFWLTEVFMLALLVLLILTYLRLGTGTTQVSRGETWALRVPISIYLGWISVATIANTIITLYSLGWKAEPIAPYMTILLLFVGAVVGVIIALRHQDIAFLLVLVWAYIGVGVPNNIADTVIVSITAYFLAAVLFILAVVIAVRPKETKPVKA